MNDVLNFPATNVKHFNKTSHAPHTLSPKQPPDLIALAFQIQNERPDAVEHLVRLMRNILFYDPQKAENADTA